LEDIVTPDQNIDAAFRTSSFLLDDGRVLVGLVTSETPTQITLVESSGKPGWHPLVVRARDKDLTVRARSGYFAGQSRPNSH